MNNIEIVSLASSIIAIICICIVGYFDYNSKLDRYLRNLAKGSDWGLGFEYWIYIALFCIIICTNSFFFWFSVPNPCRSEREIIKEYLQQELKSQSKNENNTTIF